MTVQKIDACFSDVVLPQQEMDTLLDAVITDNRKDPYQTGAAVDLRQPARKNCRMVFIGDLHGRRDNLKRIIRHATQDRNEIPEDLFIIFLGDAVHYEYRRSLADEGEPERLMMMDESIVMMQNILALKRAWPSQVYYLLGNHDYLSKKFSKRGIRQGMVYCDALREQYGEKTVGRYREFLTTSPLVMVGNKVVANHAGPCHAAYQLSDLYREGIADEEDNPLVEQLLWRRWKSFESSFTYDEHDVDVFLDRFAGDRDAYYFVGHTPRLLLYDEYRAAPFAVRLTRNHYMVFAAYDTTGYAELRYENGTVTCELVSVP